METEIETPSETVVTPEIGAQEPQEARVQADSISLFGWCHAGSDHTACRVAFRSDLTKKDYVCSCGCHGGDGGATTTKSKVKRKGS